MARPGDVIANPVSGESLRFIDTAATTGGDLLRWEHTLRRGARVPTDHVHPVQEERFEVLSGRVRVRLGREVRQLEAGQSIVLPKGTVHGLRNIGDDEARVLAEVRPALRMEELFERICALAQSGRVNRHGNPRALRAAIIADACRDIAYLPGVPVAVQKGGISILATLARAMRVKA
jgi:mannose-6-phosphate isomerase-like protein (cupin superfamily)